MLSFSHVESKKHRQKKSKKKKRVKPKNRLVAIENKLIVTRGEVSGEVGGWVKQTKGIRSSLTF